MKPKNVNIVPANANLAALSNSRSIDRDGAQDNAGKRRSAGQYFEPLVTHANLLQFRETDRSGIGASSAQSIVDLQLTPRRELRQQRQNDRRCMAVR